MRRPMAAGGGTSASGASGVLAAGAGGCAAALLPVAASFPRNATLPQRMRQHHEATLISEHVGVSNVPCPGGCPALMLSWPLLPEVEAPVASKHHHTLHLRHQRPRRLHTPQLLLLLLRWGQRWALAALPPQACRHAPRLSPSAALRFQSGAEPNATAPPAPPSPPLCTPGGTASTRTFDRHGDGHQRCLSAKEHRPGTQLLPGSDALSGSAPSEFAPAIRWRHCQGWGRRR